MSGSYGGTVFLGLGMIAYLYNMIFELEIKDGKEKFVINFLKQLDFVKVKAVKSRKKKAESEAPESGNLPYFSTLPDWALDVKEMRKRDTVKRAEGWL